MQDIEASRIESLGDHDYLVHVTQDGDLVTIRMRATPEVVARIGGPGADETRIITATMAFLTARQRPDDLPGQLDLEDIIAAYDDYLDDLHNQIGNPR